MLKKVDSWTLKRDHQYYYQVQLQMFECRMVYADFILWNEGATADPVVKQIAAHYQFVSSKLADVSYFS